MIRGLATHSRDRLSGAFRAAVFSANDGLVSDLSRVMGMAATGVSCRRGPLQRQCRPAAGALSMGASEYVSVRSQFGSSMPHAPPRPR